MIVFQLELSKFKAENIIYNLASGFNKEWIIWENLICLFDSAFARHEE